MLPYSRYSWTYKDLSSCSIEKTTKWRHTDGTWWTNQEGKVVPYNQSQHGPADKNQKIVNIDTFSDQHRKALEEANRHTGMEVAMMRPAGKAIHKPHRQAMQTLSSAVEQGVDIPAEYADIVARYLENHPKIGGRQDIKDLIEHLKSTPRSHTAGDEPSPAEQEEAAAKAEADSRAKANADAARRHRRNNPPGAGEDKYGD